MLLYSDTNTTKYNLNLTKVHLLFCENDQFVARRSFILVTNRGQDIFVCFTSLFKQPSIKEHFFFSMSTHNKNHRT